MLLAGCAVAFPLIGDTSQDLSHMEFMGSLLSREDVIRALGQPSATNEAEDSDDFSVWVYAPQPLTKQLGNTPFETPVIQRTRSGGDPRYDPPTRTDLPEEMVAKGELIFQFRGDSVAGWCTHTMDFSNRDQANRLARRGFLVDAAVMAFFINRDLLSD